jgi:hydrogenase maturation protein HypF
LREIRDPLNRRYRYPFTNCTHCGPRFSIVEALPYDRERTSMRSFRMCPRCQSEYDDPADRRFHAQPNACPECGPQLALRLPSGETVATRDEALRAAVQALRMGQVVAVKGIGGFHLWVSADDETAVSALRARKHRPFKPFAMMFPSLESVRDVCEAAADEERLLVSAEAPIVILRRKVDGRGVGSRQPSASVAPENPNLGVMLPYAPLHHLLLGELGSAVVATSGNRGDEPICTDECDAMERLRGIADVFLVHDRPIVRPVDDSVVRMVEGRPLVLRRARGYAPTAIHLDGFFGKDEGRVERRDVVGLGAQEKSAVAVSDGNVVYLGQHVGDLETPLACAAFRRSVEDLCRLFGIQPQRVAFDGHPDYASTEFGKKLGVPGVTVQHHVAHVLACLADNGTPPPALGVVWDGTGDGMDGTAWGGEFLHVTASTLERVGRLRPFRLPGGDAAVREPRRSAMGVLFEAFGTDAFPFVDRWLLSEFNMREIALLETMITRGFRSPLTSSAGRLFDAVSSLLALRQVSRFEGDAAMAVEFAAEGKVATTVYPFELTSWTRRNGNRPGIEINWAPMIREILSDRERGIAVGEIAAAFHETLAAAMVAVAQRVGEETVALSGGCFQNRRLTEAAIRRLRSAGFRVLWHQRIPPNDGGIALGQVVAALREGE